MIRMNVYNLPRFFSIVNKCNGPIFLEDPEGKREDLRRNSFLQYVISDIGKGQQPVNVNLKVSKKEDIARLLEFSIGDK